MKKTVLTLLFVLSACQMSFGADNSFFSTAESVSTQGGSPFISIGYIMQLLFSLAIVFGFIYVAAKYLLPKLQPGTKGKIIEIVDKMVLEAQVTSYIIKVKEESWFVIVSNKNIANIGKIEGSPSDNK
jgi:flagellar biogenesis protein FliO